MSQKHTLFLVLPYPLLPERIPGVLLESLGGITADDALTPYQDLKRWSSGPPGKVTREEAEGVERFLLDTTHLTTNLDSLLSRAPQGSDGKLGRGDSDDDKGETILAPVVLALAVRSFLLMCAAGMWLEVREDT